MERDDEREALAALVSLTRWGAGGNGYCAVCGNYAKRRARYTALIEMPPRELLRFSLVAGGTRALSLAVDRYMAATMREQAAGRFHYQPARYLCVGCMKRSLDQLQHTRGGTLVGAVSEILAQRGEAYYTAAFVAVEAGHPGGDYRFLVSGRGATPPVGEIARAGVAAWQRDHARVAQEAG